MSPLSARSSMPLRRARDLRARRARRAALPVRRDLELDDDTDVTEPFVLQPMSETP